MPKTWFITGTSSGFGRRITERALAQGDRVAATLRNPEALKELRDTYGEKLWVERLDVTDRDAVREVVNSACSALGEIDIVVNNAGFGLLGAAEEATDEQVHEVLETNLVGSINVIRAFLPHLRAQRHGHLVQISAAGGQTVYPNFSYYIASKWGIEGFCETVAAEMAAFGVRVTIAEPGATPTGFGGSVQTATPMSEYDSTPVGVVRTALGDGSFVFPNDSKKVVDTLLAVLDSPEPPLRIQLGSDAYQDVKASLLARLDELEKHRELAFSVVADEKKA